MSNHPLNLLIRFLIEIFALISMGIWGWINGNGIFRFLFALGIPLMAAALWGTFRVPNDPGKAPIAIPGMLRLTYEFIFFGFATWALFETDFLTIGWIFLTILLIHYLISYDRIIMMLKYTQFGIEKR